ncbi:bifunctional nicotinamidase/pyrazinamidase [Marinigracilibium pacificum]|uniref:Nicotinamidase n=1 Tax=Marinigracilibium pacificum TaxID=2729599 RepID=A0A848J2Q0_9BACT|nr:bifunctional nicotinamidase/pyrazinamidase [Marinigracilibium pacificum]NMM48764.1 bifunctional nicotinamidase/pyrazinamidase [Marinigracilibium pacificum]
MKALLIVDVQYDFLPGGALAVPNGNHIIEGINDIVERFEIVVATQDWHPDGHFSFASSHEGKHPFEELEIEDGKHQTLWPDHCVQGSKGAEISHDLDTNAIQAVIRKGMDPQIDSYSGFYDNFRKRNTGLSGYLKERQATDLYVCGLAADYCVFYTIMDAKREGFDTFFLEDLTRPIDHKGYAKARLIMENEGIELINSKNIQ